MTRLCGRKLVVIVDFQKWHGHIPLSGGHISWVPMGDDGRLSTRIVVVLLLPFFIALVAVIGIWVGLYLSKFLNEIYALPLVALFSLLGLVVSVLLSRTLINRVTSRN